MVARVRELVKRFGPVTAVDGISFDVHPGETFGLLGPNGAGKTTTMHMLLGLIAPTSGSIEILGLDASRHREEVLQQMNFSAAYAALPARLTVRENLRVFARLYGVGDDRVGEVLERFGAQAWASTATMALSSGQAAVVNLAKASLNRPRLLLLDEPTASLDPDVADRTRRTLREVAAADGTTVIITSHNMREVTELCDRVAFVMAGRIIASGPPSIVAERLGSEDLEQAFVKVARGER